MNNNSLVKSFHEMEIDNEDKTDEICKSVKNDSFLILKNKIESCDNKTFQSTDWDMVFRAIFKYCKHDSECNKKMNFVYNLDYDYNYNIALFCTIKHQHLKGIKLLIQMGADNFMDAINYCANLNLSTCTQIKMFKILCEYVGDVSIALYLACNKMNNMLICRILKYYPKKITDELYTLRAVNVLCYTNNVIGLKSMLKYNKLYLAFYISNELFITCLSRYNLQALDLLIEYYDDNINLFKVDFNIILACACQYNHEKYIKIFSNLNSDDAICFNCDKDHNIKK